MFYFSPLYMFFYYFAFQEVLIACQTSWIFDSLVELRIFFNFLLILVLLGRTRAVFSQGQIFFLTSEAVLFWVLCCTVSLLHSCLWECELFLALSDLGGCFFSFWVFLLPASGSIPTLPLIRRLLNLGISQPLCGSLELSQCSSLFPTLCLLNWRAWASSDS